MSDESSRQGNRDDRNCYVCPLLHYFPSFFGFPPPTPCFERSACISAALGSGPACFFRGAGFLGALFAVMFWIVSFQVILSLFRLSESAACADERESVFTLL